MAALFSLERLKLKSDNPYYQDESKLPKVWALTHYQCSYIPAIYLTRNPEARARQQNNGRFT